MKTAGASDSKLSIVILTLVSLVALGVPMWAQEAPAVDPAIQQNIDHWIFTGVGVPDDWSHRHVVFSNPGTREDAIKNGTYEHWLKVVNDPRFTLQQIKRSGAKTVEAAPPTDETLTLSSAAKRKKQTIKKDWNVPIGGVAASGTGTITSNGATGTSTVTIDSVVLTASAPTVASATGTIATNGATSSSTVTVDGVTFDASAPTTATGAATITTNSAVGGTSTVTIDSQVLTASAPTKASGTVTVGSPYCFAGGDGVSINGVHITTNATKATTTGSVLIAHSPSAGDTVTIAGTVYTYESSSTTCGATANCVLYVSGNHPSTVQNLYAAVNDSSGECSSGTCFYNVTTSNPVAAATYISGNSNITLSGNCAGALTVATSDTSNITVASGNGSNGTTSGPNFALPAPALNTTVATNMATAISAETSTDLVTAAAASGVVTLTANTGGPGGNSIPEALYLTPTGLTFSGSTLGTGTGTAGTCGSNTGALFAYQTGTTTCTADTAVQLASSIATAITANTTLGSLITATPGSSGSNGTIALGAKVAGSSGDYTTTASLTGFTWTNGANMTGGSDGATSGTTTPPTFAYWSGAALATPTQVASNLVTAINANTTLQTVLTGVSASSTAGVVTVTARTPGTGGNSYATGVVGFPGFTWSGADLSGGTDGTTSGTAFAYTSAGSPVSTTQLATNIASAINLNTTLSPLVTAVASGNAITVTADASGTAANSYGTTAAGFTGFAWGTGTLTGGAAGASVQPNMYPAKFSFSTTTASCSDYVVYPTGTQGSTGAASIVAFYDLYPGSSCLASGGTAPISWAYNTGGMVTTSPVLSQQGDQVAFVQVSSTGVASLVLLTPLAGGGRTATLPVTLTSQTSGANYANCTAPCMYVIPFGNGKNDTFSAPYYSYDYDEVFVGDDSGNLHEFTGVFLGSPQETTTTTVPGTTWPVNVSTLKLSSPVYDPGSGLVFVGDIGTTGTTAALHSVKASTGVLNATWNGNPSGTGTTMGDAIADAPLVDGTSGTVYAFVTTSGTYSETGDNAVYGFPTAFTSTTFPGVEPVGTGGAGYYLYAGSFDNLYYSGAPIGNLYVVGNTGTAGGATLYQIPVLQPGSFQVVGNITGSSTAVTVTTGAVETVAGAPVHMAISGTNIPTGDTISSVSGTTVNLTTAASGHVTGGTFTITNTSGGMVGVSSVVTGLNSTSHGWQSPLTEFCNNGASACTVSGGETTVGTDYLFFSVYRGAKGAPCSTSAGNGCVMSYSVNNPTATPAAPGMGNITAVGTNGCWSTSGLVVDSANGETGDSEVYFIGLGTNNAGSESGPTNSTNCTTGTGTTIGATQALQATP